MMTAMWCARHAPATHRCTHTSATAAMRAAPHVPAIASTVPPR
jgi:hypothetical protein